MASITSSTVACSGMLMVFEMAPEMNGCTAAIILRCRGSGSCACRASV